MFKKLMCLMAVLVFVSACDSTPDENASGGPGGNGSNSANIGGHKGNTVPGSKDDFVVNVGDRVFFEFNSSELTTEARATLDRQAKWLKTYGDKSVMVEGHCDERGTREYNIALGERRATAAKNYLVAEGISASRVRTISYGKERPAVLGHNEEAWAQNRRAVTAPEGPGT